VTATTRRDFMRFGAGAGGAFILEIVLPGCAGALRTPVQPTARPGDFVPNAWLRITPDDRIVFTLDRVEMGQGTMTSHAQLVAEELMINPARLVIELADSNRAYDNPDPGMGMQITGGSTSVKASFVPLREAAATAREMLRAAAARRWGVLATTCSAEDGAIVHAASGRRARYGELATSASTETVPLHATLTAPSDFKWIGTSVPRLDVHAKVDGSAVYGIDLTLPGLLNAVVLRRPTLGAKLLGFDAKAALSQPGVVDVFAIPQGVAVVASRYWQARRAAASVKVEWSAGETWVNSDTLRASYLSRAHEPATAARSEGNVDRAEREASKVIEAVYEFPYLAHAPLEPQNATAHVHDGRCEVWAPTQSPGVAREIARGITGFAYEKIVVHQTLVGGGFGRRLAQDYVGEAVEVALRVRGPVKVLFSREDEMRHSQYRPMVVSLMRGGLGPTGAVTSWRHRIVTQSILSQLTDDWGAVLPDGLPLSLKHAGVRAIAALAGGNAVADPTSVEGGATVAYGFPNLQVELAPVEHSVPVGPWRSVGFSHNLFAVEAFFDELAHAAGKDPYLARRELLGGKKRELGVLDLVAQKAGWGTALPAGRFRGISQGMVFNSYCAHVAEVSVSGADVKVHRVVVAVDCGLVVNPDIVRAQLQGAAAFGLGAAMHQEITFRNGAVEQGNFHEFEPLRMNEMPDVEVHILASDQPPSGIGEPGVPGVGPAVANAILSATGRPVRVLPFTRGLAERSAGAK